MARPEIDTEEVRRALLRLFMRDQRDKDHTYPRWISHNGKVYVFTYGFHEIVGAKPAMRSEQRPLFERKRG